MAEILQTLSIICFSVAGICFAAAVFFWFFFQIPAVIGDLSGRTARKSIARMRAANEKSGTKTYRESKMNAQRGKLTAPIPDSIEEAEEVSDDSRPETGLLENSRGGDSGSADMLAATTELLASDDEKLFSSREQEEEQSLEYLKAEKKIDMLDDIVLTHTEEEIEDLHR